MGFFSWGFLFGGGVFFKMDALVTKTDGGRTEGENKDSALLSVKYSLCLLACHLASVYLCRVLVTTCTCRDNSPSCLPLPIPLFWFVNSC